MAMTQSGLMLLAGLGVMTSVGTLRRFPDTATNLLIPFVGAVVWSFFAFSALDTIVRDNYAATASAPMWPLVFVGATFALASFAVFGDRLLSTLGRESGARESGGAF